MIRNQFVELANLVHEPARIPPRQRFQQTGQVLPVKTAKHLGDFAIPDGTIAEGERLIEQAQRITHAAGRGPRQALERTGLALSPSLAQMLVSRSRFPACGRRLRLNCRQRDNTVTGIFWVGRRKQKLDVPAAALPASSAGR